MFIHHRHPLFPIVVALISLVLVVFMYYAFSFKTEIPITSTNSVIAVTTEDYQKESLDIIASFDNKMTLATDPLAQLVVVEETLNTLLALHVPNEFQGVHLELALSLNSMKETLRFGDRNIDAALVQWQTASAKVK